ncbi:HNH endonuclease signature motif containing protein [Trujillonella endophytica]|uniref:HNH nuclease domain-containing protein n=1 Tax=Trujillonella endophytica TaxID=673521 RepID=A0A1H8PYJ7_9ACTN|nr:HNH endonuclease signature motif containing protein [Trujillella endophytica]SEO46633.1 protein of unknown function [Trujillella endophytica]
MSRIAGSVSLAEGVLVDWAVAEPAFLPRLPVELLSREQLAAELGRVVAQEAQLAAYKAELVLGLADLSPEADDPPPGVRGGRGSWGAAARPEGVSEFLPAELSVVLNCGRGAAAALIGRAFTYRTRLPGTWGALAVGVLDEPRAKVLAEVCEQASPEVARQVEGELLQEATELSLRRLREKAAAALARLDADGTDARREQAAKSADVRVYSSPREGMATVAVELPAEEAAAVHAMVDELARMLKADGDDRPIGQLRTRAYVDLVLRPWDSSRPAVTAHLHVWAALSALAGTSTQAGEVNGSAITAGHVRELLRRLDALGVRPPEGGSVTVGVTDEEGALLATATLEELRRLARRGCPQHPDRPDASGTGGPGGSGGSGGSGDSGSSGGTGGSGNSGDNSGSTGTGTGTDEPGGCGCAVLARPAAVDRYTPSAAQDRFVRTRDRTCRFPNCGQRVGWSDLDHVVPHACDGPTDCTNLCCLCRSHHRLKTFARGWHFQMSPDGVLTLTTPTGITRTTRPPGMRPPPEPADPEPDAGELGGCGGPDGPGEPDGPDGSGEPGGGGSGGDGRDGGGGRPIPPPRRLGVRELIKGWRRPEPCDPDAPPDPDSPPF